MTPSPVLPPGLRMAYASSPPDRAHARVGTAQAVGPSWRVFHRCASAIRSTRIEMCSGVPRSGARFAAIACSGQVRVARERVASGRFS